MSWHRCGRFTLGLRIDLVDRVSIPGVIGRAARMSGHTAPLMRSSGPSAAWSRGSRIGVAVGIGILVRCIFAFFYPDILFGPAPPAPSLDAISSKILEAITTLRCCEDFSLERLGLLGYFALKFD
ncbi:hypothetical protein Taro_021615, partial [Colocasia esculenta]|nr:hypothetical protein [Colocasia esculenta]